jgi:hypothetical protein
MKESHSFLLRIQTLIRVAATAEKVANRAVAAVWPEHDRHALTDETQKSKHQPACFRRRLRHRQRPQRRPANSQPLQGTAWADRSTGADNCCSGRRGYSCLVGQRLTAAASGGSSAHCLRGRCWSWARRRRRRDGDSSSA